jgi:hypothetical protein
MIVAVDFDGTCVENKYPETGNTLPYCVDVLKDLVDRGDKIVLWTNRTDHLLVRAIDWFKNNGIELAAANHNVGWAVDKIFSPKIYADIFIDDRALGAKIDDDHNIDWRWVREQLGLSAYVEMSEDIEAQTVERLPEYREIPDTEA